MFPKQNLTVSHVNHDLQNTTHLCQGLYSSGLQRNNNEVDSVTRSLGYNCEEGWIMWFVCVMVVVGGGGLETRRRLITLVIIKHLIARNMIISCAPLIIHTTLSTTLESAYVLIGKGT